MNRPLPPADIEALDAYCDGRLSGAALAAFEARLGAEPALREALAQQQSIDAALRRLFKPPVAPSLERLRGQRSAAPPRVIRSPWLVWRPIVAAAAVVLLAVGGWWQWNELNSQPPDPYQLPSVKETMVQAFEREVASGFKELWLCKDEAEMAVTFYRRFDVGMIMLPPPPNVRMLGLDYAWVISNYTTLLLARVDDQPVLVFVDRIERESQPPATCGSQMHLHRRELASLVLYELSPFDKPHILPLMQTTEVKPEWLDKYKPY